MEFSTPCPECGAHQPAGRTCQDDFYQMLFWENEHPHLGAVHHLAVLCYYLQHPSLYSQQGLQFGRALLDDFVARGVTPDEARRLRHPQVDSGRRQESISGARSEPGAYDTPPKWTLTVRDVVAAGPQAYIQKVQKWAQSVYDALNG